ncbi:unnamed protein product [Prunus brigantina]
MDVSYNLSLLLGKHVKVLKVHDRKISCSVGGFWFLVLDPLHVILSLELWRDNRGLTRPAWWTFGIVKHGGVTPINLGKSRPPL